MKIKINYIKVKLKPKKSLKKQKINLLLIDKERMNSRYNFMDHDRELVRRGVIVPVFKTKPPTDILNFKFKDKYYLSYLKARSKVRTLKLGSTEEWKKYCYLHTKLPYGVPESPEIVYRNSGWTSFKDCLGFTIIKKDLLDQAQDITPTMLNYSTMLEGESMYNTPPTCAWYFAGKVFKWLKSVGGVKAMGEINNKKAKKLYSFIDESNFYSNNIQESCRSIMNIPFLLGDGGLNKKFLEELDIIDIK